MDLVAVIPARGGSKRLPGKNIRPLGGLPLIAWTIRAAIEASIFDEIVVTTDDSGISACAQDAGARVIDRPAVLASDTACSADVVRHAIDLLKLPDAASFMLMQPTSPFRTAEHMREALALRGHGCSSVMGIVAGKPLGWALNMDSDGMLHPALSAQAVLHDDSPPYRPNGAIYLQNCGLFRQHAQFHDTATRGYVMRFTDSIDIDELDEFELAEALVSAGIKKRPA
ncbi:acylneuraminate cytidylyltransferase family protein (plasmid) [Pseudohalocynthiibacter aestuariivivens]|nr:acylneuraminate cytidylyltransferase family protein [Pseudohalocynthiibacter aestuariivivens]QIE47911.1 acylneuraminate cytidylyltransferase family protein [Pseudohalocynthiibacter aestuariivivens]